MTDSGNENGEAEDIGLTDPGPKADEITEITTEEIFEIGMGNQPCADDSVRRECQRYVALMMRTQGHKYETIATEMGCSVGWAHALVQRGIKMRIKEPVDTIRQMQIDRLENLYAAVAGDAEAGDTFKIEAALKIWDRINQFHGIEAPKRVEHSFTEDARNDALGKLAKNIAALAVAGSGDGGTTGASD